MKINYRKKTDEEKIKENETIDSKLISLQNTADFLFIQGSRWGGIGGIFFGILALFMGYNSLSVNPLNSILVLIGLFLFIEGAHHLIFPSVKGLKIEATALFIVGCWNIFITIYNMTLTEGGSGSFLAILGVFQIIWGRNFLLEHSRFRDKEIKKPSAEMIDKVKRITNKILKEDPTASLDLIMFEEEKSFGFPNFWKAKLYKDFGIFVKSKNNIMFVKLDELGLICNNKKLLSNKYNIHVRFNKKELKGIISQEHYKQFEQWKNRTSVTLKSGIDNGIIELIQNPLDMHDSRITQN